MGGDDHWERATFWGSDGMLEFYLFQKVSDVESSISQADLNRIVETVHKSPEN